MFVTSDIFDFKAIARSQRIQWREHLLGGVDVQGTHWPGYQAAARFMMEAAQRCGLMLEMKDAGYNRGDESYTRPIKPKNFERLVRGALSGAKDARAVLLEGIREADGG